MFRGGVGVGKSVGVGRKKKTQEAKRSEEVVER
jgi:hypothetical protein